MYRLKILPIVRKDLIEAREWYEKKQIGLGEDFEQKINFAIEYVGNNPHHFQTRYKELRLSLVQRFPYFIYYLIDDKRKIVIIFGILHMSRNPEVARKRIM